MEKLGLGPAELQSRNAGLVYARLSAYGGNGEHSGRPGLDPMVQAEAGAEAGTDEKPSKKVAFATQPSPSCYMPPA